MAALRAAFLGVLVAAVASFVYNDPVALRQPVDVSPVLLPALAVPAASDPSNRLASAEIMYANEGIGPESLAIDANGAGPYSGLADGRVVRRSADDSQWEPFAQASPNRTSQLCNRYWLKGSKAGSHEVMVDLPGVPDNPRLNPRGRFWIAMPAYRTSAYDFLARTPRLRSILLRLNLHPLLLYAGIFGLPNGLIAEVDSSGQITEILEDRAGKRVQAPSEVMERDGKLWIASLIVPHLAVLDYTPGGGAAAAA
ncbi:unnamed protein product [Closterium sp. NIES-54]